MPYPRCKYCGDDLVLYEEQERGVCENCQDEFGDDEAARIAKLESSDV